MKFACFRCSADLSTVWRGTPRKTVIPANFPKVLASVAIDTGLFVDFAPADTRWQGRQ